MKIFRNIIVWTLAIINIIVVLAMVVCSYSVYLSPAQFPNWSYLGMVLPACILATVAMMVMWIIFKWKYALISIAGIALCWSSIRDYCPINPMQGTPTGKTLKVLSYNVYSFGGKALDQGDSSVIEYITTSEADIVCLQEVSKIKHEAIRSRLELAYPHIMVDNEKDNKNAILSRYPILTSDTLHLNTKSASGCEYTIDADGDTIVVINLHLESYQLDDDDKLMYKQMIKNSAMIGDNTPSDPDDEAVIDMTKSFWWLEGKLAKANSLRAGQADIIGTRIDSLLTTHRHVIVCGDFNDSPVSYVHHRLTRRLNDAYTQSGNGPGWSYNRHAMYFRIDHILASESFTSYGAKVDKTVQESDHYPIFCTLEIR